MKRLFTLAIITILGFSATAQLSIDDTLLTMSGNLAGKHTFSTQLHNNSNDTLNLEWSRLDIGMPGSWYAQICTDILCYDSSDTHGQFFPLTPGGSVPIICYIVDDESTVGEGSIKVAVYDGRDSINNNVSVRFKFNGTSVGIAEISADIGVYPNPVSNQLVLDLSATNKSFTSIELIDISGVMVNRQEFLDNNDRTTVQMEHLPKGIYFLALKDENGVVARKRVIKQ